MRHSNETSKEKKARKAKEKTELREERKALARWDRNIKRLRNMGAVMLLALTISATSVAQQFSIDVGAGASTKGKVVAELTTQCDFGPAFIQTGYIAHLSRAVDLGTYINVRAGHSFRMGVKGNYFLEPSAGWAWILRSSDHPEMNSQAMIYSVKAGKNINQGSLYLGTNYSEKVLIGIIGIRYNF